VSCLALNSFWSGSGTLHFVPLMRRHASSPSPQVLGAERDDGPKGTAWREPLAGTANTSEHSDMFTISPLPE
jgi:hypothetical protein